MIDGQYGTKTVNKQMSSSVLLSGQVTPKINGTLMTWE